MKTRKYAMIVATIRLSAILTAAFATTAVAQTPSPSHGKMSHERGSMKEMKGMGGMMEGPHHALAMAYGENLATFARALQGHVNRSKSVDLDLAKPAVAEMVRSIDQMKEHHAAQMKMMGDQRQPMAGMEQQHDTQLASLSEHLTALQSEVNLSTPDPRKVAAHTGEILKQCARMSKMSGKAMRHAMN